MNDQTDETKIDESAVSIFFKELEKLLDTKTPFFQHMKQSKLEFLKAIRSLIDERIERMEKDAGREEGDKGHD